MRLSIVGVPKDLTIHIRLVLSVFGSSISCISVEGFNCRQRRVSVRVFTELSPSSRFFVLLSWLILYMSIISLLSCELKYGKMLSGMAFHASATVICAIATTENMLQTSVIIDFFIVLSFLLPGGTMPVQVCCYV